MASNVFAAALRQSRAEGNDRNVLLALADCAWRDGVTWILIGDGKDDEAETICKLARVSRQTAWRAIATLRDDLGEIQTVRVRRGRSFVTVYRVLCGAVDVDYERIPFELPHRFDEADVQRFNLEPSTVGPAADWMDSDVAGTASGERFNLQRSDESSTLQIEPVQRFKSAPFNVSDSTSRVKSEPKENRKQNLSSSTTSNESADRAAAELLDRHLTDLGVAPAVRRAALDEPERAQAWLELAATQATRNPGGFFVACFTAGGFPSERVDERQTSIDARREWVTETSWRLHPDDAHVIVDDWRDLDDVERAELHEQVDRERVSRSEASAA